MGQVTVTLNGRTYRLSCGAGEEPRLLLLAGHVKERIDALADEFGHAGDDRLLLMAALLVTDELFDARDRLMALATAQALASPAGEPPAPGPTQSPDMPQTAMVAARAVGREGTDGAAPAADRRVPRPLAVPAPNHGARSPGPRQTPPAAPRPLVRPVDA